MRDISLGVAEASGGKGSLLCRSKAGPPEQEGHESSCSSRVLRENIDPATVIKGK